MRSLEEGCWKSIDKITRWQPILLHAPFCRRVGEVTLRLSSTDLRQEINYPIYAGSKQSDSKSPAPHLLWLFLMY